MDRNKYPLHIPSLVLGIIGLVSFWFTLGISGVVCGIVGMNLTKKAKGEYRVTAGFVLSLISTIIGAIFVMISLFGIAVLILMPDSIGAYYIRDMIPLFR